MEQTQMDCPIELTVQLIGNKWKPIIIHHLLEGKKRFNELKRLLPNISQKILTDNLRALEEDGIITRTVYPEVPVRVEYELTDIGRRLYKVIDEMRDWGEEYRKD
ncbi:DNA-binding HxlR family transcriptional regulator [Aequitasia blattaphilus]|uniref:Helix-turn-helix transcriptional regulator n=1 Tax=Aequitasia blattaphilus TaxID=2949332 RepID=A0ABT1EBU3_9FIRM|nr:helix-turn-helix domain-containing protein [Aequitasia blattaphilus]MCP1103304.1 helix-turn-helix transcriptional regulator [Aequitasia blattaphilus]MCR8615944.1 helix-turn-helix transcriptional regulator [Aequitasia blattaphilus]